MNSKIVIVAVAIVAICVIAAGAFILTGSEEETHLDRDVVDVITNDPNRETATADGRLWIIGNANLDDVLDQKDIDWIQKIIDGKANEVLLSPELSEWSETARMADANQDGVVNQEDIEKVKSMIASNKDSPKQKIYYIDVDGAVNSMHIPVSTVLSGYEQNSKQLQTIHALDMCVATDKTSHIRPYAAEILKDVPYFSYTGTFNPDAEMIMGYNPDIIVTGTRQHYCKELEQALPPNRTNMDIVRISSWEDGKTIEGTLTLGFMLGKTEEAMAYAEWADKWFGTINEKVSTLSQDQIVKVLSPRGAYDNWNIIMNGPRGGKYETTLLAGADNIITRNLTSSSTNITVTDEWVKAQSDLDYIVAIVYGGLDNSSRHVNVDPVYPGGQDYNNKSFYDTAVEYWKSMTNAYGTEVHVIDNLVSQGTTYVIGAVYMAKWFYPDLFQDMDPDAIFQEFMDKFFQYDFNVAEFQANGGIAI